MQKLACSRPLWVAWQDRWRATRAWDCAGGSTLVLGCTLSTNGCSRTEGLHWYWLLSAATPEPAVQTRSLHLLCRGFMHSSLGCAGAGEQSCLCERQSLPAKGLSAAMRKNAGLIGEGMATEGLIQAKGSAFPPEAAQHNAGRSMQQGNVGRLKQSPAGLKQMSPGSLRSTGML